MASPDPFLQLPGEGASLSQVMSPSAQGHLAASTFVAGEPAYGATQGAAQLSSGGAQLRDGQQVEVSNGLPNPNVYDPAPMAGVLGMDSQGTLPPDLAA